MEIAKKELQNIITPDKPREITPQLIIEVVSEHFQISLDQMISKTEVMRLQDQDRLPCTSVKP